MTAKQPGQRNVVAKPFYTISELAIRWGVSKRQIQRWIQGDELKVHRFGRSVRISAPEVAHFESRCALRGTLQGIGGP